LLEPALEAILSGRAGFLHWQGALRVDDRKTILVIDDYETSAAGWGLYLHNAKYSVETAYSPEEGLQLFAIRPIDLVLLDYAMPAIDGGQVAAAMKHIKPSVPILMLSGVPHVPEQDLANIDAFVQKGQEPALVLEKIEQLLARPQQAA
jgi:CheY-like chemotaxis protein